MRTRHIFYDIIDILQDGKMHTIEEMSVKLQISRSTCIRHLNDLSTHYQIRTFVGGRHGGVKLIGQKKVNVNLNDEKLKTIIAHLKLLNDPEIQEFTNSLDSLINREKEDANWYRSYNTKK